MQIKNKQAINERKKILEKAKIGLKKKFIGIDQIIDQFISSVESWFLYPEFRTKPLIVNLWGITGVGKTALIREFVDLIGYQKNFCEIDSSSSDIYMLKDTLFEAGIESDTSAILLIDEFQKLKTVNEKDEENGSDSIVDLWTFLSDGSFPVEHNLRATLTRFTHDLETNGKGVNSILNGYDQQIFKNYIKGRVKNQSSLSSNIRKGTAVKILKKLIDCDETYKHRVFSNLLIVISGNLDEAFYFSRDVFDADTDADIYSEMSSDIKITGIKRALLKRFRPEQIARLGNLHIIYPVLDRKAYTELIKKTVDTYIKSVEKEFSIKITIDKTLYDAIYENGVFPTQGVRPVFSTIALFVESSLSNIICEISEKEKDLSGIRKLNLVFENSCVVCDVNGTRYTYKVNEILNAIRSSKSQDMWTLHAVHEAGHAVMQALEYGVAPRQVVACSSDTGTGGFCTTYKNSGSKEQFKKDIKISLAGRLAEEIVFGKYVTSGASSDLSSATSDVMCYILDIGFDMNKCVHDGNRFLDMDDNSQKRCEHIISELYNDGKDLLMNNKKFLIAVADELIKSKTITADEFINIANKFNIHLEKKKLGESIDENFSELFKTFKNNLK